MPLKWKSFKIGELFENIQQGARLKKEDHIQGDLPFVMAGITNNGVCGFIGNDNARKFKANAITIDILGNVFYRDYDFGASDDVGVFWNEHKLFNKEIMLFICASIQKSLMGRFDFGNKLRASRAFDLLCLLPVLDSRRQDFGDKNGALQGESRELPKVVMTADEPKQSPFLAQKPTPSINFNFIESFIKAIQKECIKSVVLWQEQEREAYRKVVENS